MRFLGWTELVIAAAFGLIALPSPVWAAPAASANPPAAPPAGTAAKPSFVAPRAIPSSAMKNWPAYPPAARQAHREGIVLLSVRISAQGAPSDVKVAKSSTFPDLDLAAVAAVRNWQFTPATRDGTAVETTVNLPINFSLKTAETQPATASADSAKPQPAQVQDKPKPKPKVAQKPAPKPKAKPSTPKSDDASPPASTEPQEPAKEAN